VRGGALPPALLFAAFGFALSFAPRRLFAACLAALVAVAVAVSRVRIGPQWDDDVFLGCWISVLIAAGSVHLPKGLGPRLALVLAVNSGLWGGAVISAAGGPLDLLKALPWALLCLPGAWLVATKRQIVIKVLTSWLIAVALLAGTLQITTPTPGYVADHMD
jgi:hypothetical protein